MQFALFDQPLADRAVGMAVLVGIADAYAAAVVELDLPGALDLQEEETDWIVQLEQRLPGAPLFLGRPFRPAEVGYQLAPLDAAAQAHVLEFRI